MAEIADELGISERTVQRYLRELDVEARAQGRKALYPEPVPRPCGCGCGTVVSAATPYEAAHGRGKYVDREHSAAAQRVYPEPGERTCSNARCGSRFRPAPEHAARSDGAGSHCSLKCYWESDYFRELASERARLSWEKLTGLGRGALGRKRRDGSSWASKSVKCSHGGRKPPGPDARPRGRPRAEVPLDLAAEVRRLAALEWGRVAIAKRTRLPERVVRRLMH